MVALPAYHQCRVWLTGRPYVVAPRGPDFDTALEYPEKAIDIKIKYPVLLKGSCGLCCVVAP